MIKDVTVLYYSANTEREGFEWHVRNNVLKQKGDLPLISVTQKPFKGISPWYITNGDRHQSWMYIKI
jgi:hypothetical protein